MEPDRFWLLMLDIVGFVVDNGAHRALARAEAEARDGPVAHMHLIWPTHQHYPLACFPCLIPFCLALIVILDRDYLIRRKVRGETAAPDKALLPVSLTEVVASHIHAQVNP